MRIRLVWFVLLAAVVALALGLLSGSIPGRPKDLLTPEERAWVRKHGAIKMAPDPEFPPIEFFDDQGRYRGISADLFQVIGDRLNVRFQFVRLKTWNDVLEQARLRKIDGITAAQMTPERSKYLVYSRPILDIPNVIIARRGTEGPLSFESMGGMSVAVTRGYANVEYIASQHPKLKLVEQPNDLVALQQVSFGEVDAAVVNLAIASYLIERYGLTNLSVVGDSGRSNALMIASRSDVPILNRILDKGLASISESEKQDVVRRWVHLEPAARDMRPFWLALAGVAAAVAIGVAAVGVWNHLLRRQVQIRTELIRSQNEQLQQQFQELEEKGEQVLDAQDKLRSLNIELEQRVQRRTMELEIANQELEAFAYSVSHDLRAPLRAVDGFSFALLEDYGPNLEGEARDYIDRIRRGALKMSELIDDLLNLSRISRTELKLEWVDMTELASEVGLEIARTHPAQKVHIDVRQTPEVKGDPALLRIALQNLLENSWKFTSKKDAATVEFGYEERGGGGAYYVKDNGAGFEQSRAQNLFAPFQRLHTEAEFEGTGIGLAIVQRVVRRHGGTVWAEGSVDRGATFYFSLDERTVPAGPAASLA
jgi:signal transduction histidine kinase